MQPGTRTVSETGGKRAGQMHFIQRFNLVRGDQRFTLSLLVAVTGLALTLQNPQARDSAAELLSRVELPNPAQVLEMRPKTPPPGVEGDQLATDEGEEIQIITLIDRDEARSPDLRRSPERPSSP